MRRLLAVAIVVIATTGLVVAIVARTGLPMRAPQPPNGFLVGTVSGLATDPSRSDLFSGAAQRVVPFQILYPAMSLGKPSLYVPDAGAVIAALAASHGWIFRVFLGQIGTLPAPWTDAAEPVVGGPFPVIISLPGVTGYMQMGSYQTAELAAQGFVVVTLNQPGAVAAVALPDGQIVIGMNRENAVSLVAPSYRTTGQALPDDLAQKLAPELSIVPYFAADVSLVLDRLAQINADPRHILHGMLDLDRVGVMGLSLGAIVTAHACASDDRIIACLMMDAPVPASVAASGLRQPALWITRPPNDQRVERAASGGWPEEEIAAQAQTVADALFTSEHGEFAELHGLFHIDFTDLAAVQPVLGWFGQSGATGVVQAHREINRLTKDFFARSIGRHQD